MSILEEAIVDAKALKEAALKNAEALVVEKYSEQVKEAVNNILEQGEEDELDLGLDAEMGGELGMDGPEGESDVADQIPLAGAEGEVPCGCGEDEEIEIDFGELEKALEMDDEVSSGEMLDREEIADEIAGEEEPVGLPVVEENEEVVEEENVEEGCDKEDLDEEIELDEEKLEEIAESEEVVEEENVEEEKEIKEEVVIDQENVPNGWSGANSMEKEIAQDTMLAKAQHDEETKKEIEQLKKAQKALDENLSQTRKENNELKKIVNKLKETLNETNLMNVKLIYKNKVLGNNSLNGQQKNQIAESISKASTVEETKTIFETVSNVAGSGNKKSGPKSLREAVMSRSPSPFTRRTEKTSNDPAAERMRVLAGIRKNK